MAFIFDMDLEELSTFIEKLTHELSPLHRDIVLGFYLKRDGYCHTFPELREKYKSPELRRKVKGKTMQQEAEAAKKELLVRLQKLGFNKLEDIPLSEKSREKENHCINPTSDKPRQPKLTPRERRKLWEQTEAGKESIFKSSQKDALKKKHESTKKQTEEVCQTQSV